MGGKPKAISKPLKPLKLATDLDLFYELQQRGYKILETRSRVKFDKLINWTKSQVTNMRVWNLLCPPSSPLYIMSLKSLAPGTPLHPAPGILAAKPKPKKVRKNV